MGLKSLQAASTGATATVITRTVGGDATHTVTASKIVGGLWDGFDVAHEARHVGNIALSGVETVQFTKGATTARLLSEWNATGFLALVDCWLGFYFDVVGDCDFKVKGKHRASSANLWDWGLGQWQTNVGATNMKRGNYGGVASGNTHQYKCSHDGVDLGQVTGAAVTHTSYYWLRLTRTGSNIKASWSLDGSSWTDTVDDSYDHVGNACRVGAIFGSHTGATDANLLVDITDVQLTYFPAT